MGGLIGLVSWGDGVRLHVREWARLKFDSACLVTVSSNAMSLVCRTLCSIFGKVIIGGKKQYVDYVHNISIGVKIIICSLYLL